MLHTATLDSFAGWLVSAILILLFVRQSRSTRLLRQPQFDGEAAGASVSLLIVPGAAAGFRDRVIAAASQRTSGPVQIVVAIREGDDTTASVIEPLRLAHDRIEIVRLAGNDVLEQLSARATERFRIYLSSDVSLQSNAVEALAGQMIDAAAAYTIALPRADGGTASDRLLAGWWTFLQLTLGGRSALAEVIRSGNIAIVDRDSPDDIALPHWIAAGEIATTPAAAAAGVIRHLPFGNRLAIAAALVALFTGPLVAAIVTRQFSFVVATILGIWLRLRIATRTGEPIENALLQPLTAAWAAVSILTKS